MKTKKQILWITQTALLLGLTVAAQYYLMGILGTGFSGQLTVGSLVNLFLVLSTLTCGFWSGFSIAAITPFISFAIGKLPHPWLIPFVILGNTAIVFVFRLICRKKTFKAYGWAFAAIIGALLKFGVLWFGATQIFLNYILPNDAALQSMQITKMTAIISVNYSFPQLATALIGCILAYVIYPVLKRTVIERKIYVKNE